MWNAVNEYFLKKKKRVKKQPRENTSQIWSLYHKADLFSLKLDLIKGLAEETVVLGVRGKPD